MDDDVMQAVMRDVAMGRAVAESKLVYTSEMFAFRSRVEREFEEWRKRHPGAELAIPNGVQGLP